MLVLTRKLQEGIWIGSCLIRVVEIGQNKVQLGITAPPEVKIKREELLNKPQNTGEKPLKKAVGKP